MADALLAGLPRIVRVAEEVRLRGWLALAVGGAAATWWTIQWLLDEPLEVGRTWLYALVVSVLGTIAGLATGPARIRESLKRVRTPNARVVYETRADGRDRRVRLSGAVFLTVIVVLTIDRLALWDGVTAGLVLGAAVGLGVSDLIESRRWRRIERERQNELYIKIGSHALVAGYGPGEIYESPAPPPERVARAV